MGERRGFAGLGAVFLTLAFVLFTSVGLLLLVGGDGQDRTLGLILVLLFGLGGLAHFASRRRRREGALRVQTITWHGEPVRCLVAPVRRSKWLTMIVGAFGMGAATVLMAMNAPLFRDPGESPLFVQIVGYGGGAFFLGLGLLGLSSVRNGPPRLALLEEGIDLSGTVSAFVRWDAISEVGRYDMTVRGATQRFVGLRLINAGDVERPKISRLLMTGSRAMSGWDVTYSEAIFDLDADQLMDLIAEFHARPQLRRVAASLPEGNLGFDEFASQHLRGVPPEGDALPH